MDKVLQPLIWKGNSLYILDQRKLPLKVEFTKARTLDDVAEAIKTMKVRGAPAIGIAAGYGLALWSLQNRANKNFVEDLKRASRKLIKTRPTAVNLSWAVERIISKVEVTNSPEDVIKEAIAIHREDIEANLKIGEYGASLIRSGWNLLTHCNAGALATGGYGTALGVIRTAVKRGKKIKVFANETRPFLQGSRLTAWELKKDGIDVTVITDSCAGFLMQKGEIDAVIVGADRITASGDFANKIGTYSLAVLAHAHRIPFFVAAPLSTFDLTLESGEEIPIEERDWKEVAFCGNKRIAPPNVKIRNPAFDITPSKFVTAFITEKGVIRKPFKKNIKKVVGVK